MSKYNSAEIDFIQARACERVTEVFDAMGMEYVERRDYYQGVCPVHAGDNSRAWYWAINTSHWRCSTQHCEQNESTGRSHSIFGLIRGVMAHKTQSLWSFQNAVDFAARVLNLNDTQLDPKTVEEAEIDRALKDFRKRAKEKAVGRGPLLADSIPNLKPDTIYYPTRGVTADIIAKYHISYCDDPAKPFYQRAFVPVLDDTGRHVMGWTARSIFEKCPQCKTHHAPDLCSQENKHKVQFAKWRHSAGYHAEQCLYNLWYAKPHIHKSATAVVGEGPGDTWAYEMAGIHNSVSMLGLNFSSIQRKMLQRAGALTLVFTVDNDKAGRESKERLMKELNWYFRVLFVTPQGAKDIGAMGSENIQDQIGTILHKVSLARLFKDSYEGEEHGTVGSVAVG